MGDINTTSNVASLVIASIKVSHYTLLRGDNGWGHVSKKKEKKVSVKCVCVCKCACLGWCQNDTLRNKQTPT